MKHTQFHRNEKLKTIKDEWRGNINHRGKYVNLERKRNHGMGNFFKMKIRRNPERHIKRAENWDPQFTHLSSISQIKRNAVVWLGHNTFFMCLDGKRFMFDPVFGDIPFVKRKSIFPSRPSVFKDIDFLLLSHDHYDHLDKKSVKSLSKYSPNMTVVCGLGLKKLIEKWVAPSVNIIESGWYQQYSIDSIKITFLPCQHWGKRGANDASSRLWGSFMVQSENLSLYYSGDTGFSSHFEEIPKLFGKPDYCIIGIGTYKPRWFMQPNHISPYEALDAAEIMGAKITIPMHYGTFDLSEEPLSDPPRVFKDEADNRNINVEIPHLGEIVYL